MEVTKEQQIIRLASAVQEFVQCVLSINEGFFLQKLNNWTPRDIVAHLIGWNRYIIRGSSQIKKGQLPFYDVDPGEDYSKINAELVRQYSATDRHKLLIELTESVEELKRFLADLDEAEWNHDFGVRHRGQVVTIRSSVNDVMEDYAHHKTQMQAWLASEKGG